jgi:hypothetical protein
MSDVLKVAGFLGGSVGALIGIVAFLFVPDLCTPGQIAGIELPGLYDCFGLGSLSQVEWAAGFGGIAGIAVGIAKWIQGTSSD